MDAETARIPLLSRPFLSTYLQDGVYHQIGIIGRTTTANVQASRKYPAIVDELVNVTFADSRQSGKGMSKPTIVSAGNKTPDPTQVGLEGRLMPLASLKSLHVARLRLPFGWSFGNEWQMRAVPKRYWLSPPRP